MVHKLKEQIMSHLEEDIKEAEAGIKKDQELMAQLKNLEKPAEQKPVEEDEGDIMDDYAETMDEFIDSLGSAHKDESKTDKEKEVEEMRALG